MPRLYGGMARVEIMGWSGLYGGMARLIWWDVQAVNMGWPGLYGGDGQGATFNVNMIRPGVYGGMARVQHDMSRV